MSSADADNVNRVYGAGKWFPADPRELSAMVNGFLDGASMNRPIGRVVGAIAPHAGYIYSGKVAGHTFRAIRDSVEAGNVPDTVVVLGSCHQMGFGGVALMDGKTLNTPLGESTLDHHAAEVLAGSGPGIEFNNAPHMGEHSAENEVPFIQAALPGVGLVVALMGNHDERTLTDLVAGLERLAVDREVLVVASTDMLHDEDYDLVSDTDRVTLTKVESMDTDGIMSSWDYSRQVFCGIGPVIAVMRFSKSRGCGKGNVLCYRNSGDDFPESRGSWVVGYGAAVFTLDK